MITYAERVCFRDRHLKLLSRCSDLVSSITSTWGNELRCHEIARALHVVLADPTLLVVDGWYGPFDHSWIRTEDRVIVDPYAPGRLPAVQIIDDIVAISYRAGMPRQDIREGIVQGFAF